jgi:hypothetical protein
VIQIKNHFSLGLKKLRRTTQSAASAVVSLSLLANCAGDLPARSFVKSDEAVKQREAEWDNKPAITTVRLPGRFFLAQPLHAAPPLAIANKRLDINMPGGAATLDDLITILESQGISVSYSWDSANNADDIGARRLPFRRFQGTVNELLSRLQMGMSLASWWNNNTLYVSPLQRYTVKIPQNDDIMNEVVGQLETFGATDIMSSLLAGQVSYSASPEANEELISPFLKRIGLNMSEITLQVALVRVEMDEAARRGFDWSSFNIGVQRGITSTTTATSSSTGTTGTGTGSTTGTTTGTSTGSTGSTTGSTGTGTGTTGTASTTTINTGSALSAGIGNLVGFGTLGTAANSSGSGTTTSTNTGVTTEGSAGVTGLLSSVPNLVGEASLGHLSLSAAIGFLSEFGTTSTDQNVELRTLSGQAVSLRDGGETPYVSQITSNATTGGNTSNTSSSVQFETVDTGLTLDMTPTFDASSGIVTVDVELTIEDIESFLQISAGAGNGTIERPVTSNRELRNIVRAAAGETIILGGVTKISKTDSRNAPLEFWSIGADNSETDRVALFIILRPFVTVYEMEGNELLEEPAQTLNPVESATDGNVVSPAAQTIQQSLTKPSSRLHNVPEAPAPVPTAELQPAILPSRVSATAPQGQPTPTSLNTAGSSGNSTGYFNNLVGQILVQPTTAQ